jgi:coatomer subunit beta'
MLGVKGEVNLALLCQFILSNHNEVIKLLLDTSRFPEAAFYSRTYCPSQISNVVNLWKKSLVKAGKSKMADAIADPVTYQDKFPDYQISLDIEKVFGGIKNAGTPPATAYGAYSAFDSVDVISGIPST